MKVTFRYKPMLGRLSPTATLGLCVGGTWRRADFYVDSGAAYSMVHGDFARDCGFDFESGTRLEVKVGDGTLIPIFLHRIPLQIGQHFGQGSFEPRMIVAHRQTHPAQAALF